MFASHYHYTWFENNPDPAWKATATWLGLLHRRRNGHRRRRHLVPQGVDLCPVARQRRRADEQRPAADHRPHERRVQRVQRQHGDDPALDLPAEAILPEGGTGEETKYLSFLTPIGGTFLPNPTDAGASAGDAGAAEGGGGGTSEEKVYCGKAVFTDLHTSSGLFATAMNVPGDCKAAALTAQQKALEYLFFDLAACVAPENAPTPTPPPNPPPPPPPPM